MTPAAQPASRRAAPRSAFVGQARGAAALAVVAFHSFGAESGQPVWAPLAPIRAVADLGWLGVHVFFILSGYCMAEKIASLAAAGRGSGHFLADRAWRIFPAYWGALLLAIVLGLASAPFNSAGVAGALPASFRAVWAEAFLLQPYLATTGILLVGWTLVCETGFYAIVAVLLSGWRAGLGLGGVLLAGAMITLAAARVPTGDAWLVLRLWPEFWLGMLAYGCLASHWPGRTNPPRACRVGLVVLGSLFATTPAGFFAEVHVAAFFTAAALVGLRRWDARLGLLPATRWLGSVGVWSFSLYLVHAPILSRWHNLAIRFAPADSPFYALQWLAGLALALGGGWLFYRTVEFPLEKWRHRRTRPVMVSP